MNSKPIKINTLRTKAVNRLLVDVPFKISNFIVTIDSDSVDCALFKLSYKDFNLVVNTHVDEEINPTNISKWIQFEIDWFEENYLEAHEDASSYISMYVIDTIIIDCGYEITDSKLIFDYAFYILDLYPELADTIKYLNTLSGKDLVRNLKNMPKYVNI